MQLPRILAAFLALFLFSSCASSPQARIESSRSVFDAFPADVQEKIRAGRVELGFERPMVWLALGDPDRELRRASDAGEEEVWVYRRTASGFGFGLGIGGGGGHTNYGAGVSLSTAPNHDEDAMRVVFREGRVTAIETRVK